MSDALKNLRWWEQWEEIPHMRGKFSASDDMKAAADELDRQSAQSDAKDAEIAHLRDALEFYAEPRHWIGLDARSEFKTILIGPNKTVTPLANGWVIARAALADTAPKGNDDAES